MIMNLPKNQSEQPNSGPQPISPGDPAAGRVGLKVICDNCKEEIGDLQAALSGKPAKGGFGEVGLTCPHCRFFVHSYYTNPKLEQARRVLANFKARALAQPDTRKKYEKKIIEFQGKHNQVQEAARKMKAATE